VLAGWLAGQVRQMHGVCWCLEQCTRQQQLIIRFHSRRPAGRAGGRQSMIMTRHGPAAWHGPTVTRGTAAGRRHVTLNSCCQSLKLHSSITHHHIISLSLSLSLTLCGPACKSTYIRPVVISLSHQPIILTVRRYVCVVYAIALCLSVCLSQVGVLSSTS